MTGGANWPAPVFVPPCGPNMVSRAATTFPSVWSYAGDTLRMIDAGAFKLVELKPRSVGRKPSKAIQ